MSMSKIIRRFLKDDEVFGLIWFIAGLVTSIGALKLELGVLEKPGPGFMPFLLGLALAVLGLVLMLMAVITHLTTEQGERKEEVFERDNLTRLLFVVAILLGYIVLFDYVGFVSSSFLFFFLLLKYLTPKKWLEPLIISGSAVLISYLVFCVWLKAQLPGGIFNIG